LLPLFIHVFIQFEEDEGEDGKTPNRRVPSNHVMADPDVADE
jgi:hypothetical protein